MLLDEHLTSNLLSVMNALTTYYLLFTYRPIVASPHYGQQRAHYTHGMIFLSYNLVYCHVFGLVYNRMVFSTSQDITWLSLILGTSRYVSSHHSRKISKETKRDLFTQKILTFCRKETKPLTLEMVVVSIDKCISCKSVTFLFLFGILILNYCSYVLTSFTLPDL